MKALSIWQPWAFAIVSLGKDIENRCWRTRYRGPLLIHASKTVDEPAFEFLHQEFLNPDEMKILERYPSAARLTGGIVGVCELVDCVDTSSSRWFNGPYGFVLRNARRLPFVKMPGRQGLFNVDVEAMGISA